MFVIGYSAFRRWTDWRAGFLLLMALAIGLVENTMVAVCKSWYAFIYDGAALFGNTCTVMTGWEISIWFVAAIVALVTLWTFRSWMDCDGDEYTPTGYFVAYIKPSKVTFWKMVAMLFTFPYAGKCWIVNGIGYRYKDGYMNSFIPNESDYKLVRADTKPDVWVGKRWALLNNCVVQK